MFKTPAGRQLIIAEAEQRLGDRLESKVEIKSLTGSLPGVIVINDVAISDPDGVWLQLDHMELRWRPMDLLSKRLTIETLTVDGGHLFRPPPDRGDAEPDDDPRLIRLVDDLPSISINAINLANFSADLYGETERIGGSGVLHMGGAGIRAQIALASTNDRDTIDINIDLDPAQDKFDLDVRFDARAAGVIAALTGFDGDLSLSANNQHPLSAYDVRFAGNLGAYGAFSGAIANERSDSADVNIDLSVLPGSAISATPELSSVVTAKMRLSENDRGGVLVFDEILLAAGKISGALTWQNRRNIVDQLDIDLNADAAVEFRPALQNILGSTLSLSGRLSRKGARYAIDAQLSGENAAFSISDGETDLRNLLAGDIAASLSPFDGAPQVFSAPLALTAQLNADLSNKVQLENIFIQSDEGGDAFGAVEYSLREEILAIDGDVTVTPAMLAAAAPSLRAEADINAEFELSGPLDRLTLQAKARAPALNTGNGNIPASAVDIALAGLPQRPTGTINAIAADPANQGGIVVELRSSQEGLIAAPVVRYRGVGFSLSGAAQIDPVAGTGAIDLAYEGDSAAQPWPGVVVHGDVTVSGVASSDDNKLNINSSALKVGSTTARGFSLDAGGAASALNLSVSATEVASPQTGPINGFNAAALIDLAEAQSVRLTALEGVIGGSRAHLTAPATIRFDNGVAISGFEMADGAGGSIAVDAAFSDARWQATAAIDNANIPHADGALTLDLKLDTDDNIAAQGQFELRSLLTTGSNAAIGGNFKWDHEILQIVSAPDQNTLDLEINYPLKLARSPELSIDASGALSGHIRYDSDIRAMTPYLPPTLQSLEGALKADFVLQGRTDAPEISGEAQIADGKFTEIQSGFSLVGVHVEADARHGGDASVIRFTGGARGAGQSDGDTIALTGDVALGKGSSLNLAVSLDDAELSAAPISTARLNGSINLSGSLSEIVATGDISVEELDAEIVTPENTGLVDIAVVTYEGDAPPDMSEAPTTRVLNEFNIAIAADDRIFIRGRGLESEWSANVQAVNTRAGPLIIGDMNLQRGALDFSGRRFDLVRGAIAFDRLSANNPLLDIRAEYETSDGVTAIIAVTGRADEPKVELLSTPSMPSENIMALVLFGKQADELSAVESLQTAQALAALGGIGPFGGEGITGTLRQAVGLDLLNFDLDPENGGGSLTVGKYVADGFFVSATQDAQGQAGSVRVEYEIIDSLTIESEIEQDGDQTVSANWKHDF